MTEATHILHACLTNATVNKVHGEFTTTVLNRVGLNWQVQITHHSDGCYDLARVRSNTVVRRESKP